MTLNLSNRQSPAEIDYANRLGNALSYQDWKAANPAHANTYTTPEQYYEAVRSIAIHEVYDSKPRASGFYSPVDGITNSNAPWYEVAILPGGFGIAPTNPTTQKVVAGGLVGAITVAALLVWGGNSVPVEKQSKEPVPAVSKDNSR